MPFSVFHQGPRLSLIQSPDVWLQSPPPRRHRLSAWQNRGDHVWIKQHLRIKAFFGTSENALKTQIWIAVSVYVLVAIVKKRLKLSASLYEILQILSLTMFERTPLHQLLTLAVPESTESVSTNQLILFE
jgi:hypothetical protein